MLSTITHSGLQMLFLFFLIFLPACIFLKTYITFIVISRKKVALGTEVKEPLLSPKTLGPFHFQIEF